MRKRCLALGVLAVACALPLGAADWPAWRGPDRTGVCKETGLLKVWPKGGPKLLWTFDKAGSGYAGPAVVGGIIYTMGTRGTDEVALAVDAKGKELWATKIGPIFDFKSNRWSRGPNATPTVDGDLVFALGSQGQLLCANKANGKQVWTKNLPKELKGDITDTGGGPAKMGWGYSWSPLVDGDKLIITPGGPDGLVAALDKKTGKVLWRSKAVTAAATYSSPIVSEAGGVRHYVCMMQNGVVGVSAKDGAVLWEHKREDDYPDVVCPTPIIQGNFVYVTVGESSGGGLAELLEVTAAGGKFKVKSVWEQAMIASYHGGVVMVGKHVYGYHSNRNWVCQEFATGKVAWSSKGAAPKAGGLIAADGRLYVLDDKGLAAMLEASPAGYKLISSFPLPQKSKLRKPGGAVWTHPVIADGKMYLRDQELIFCYQVK